MTPYVGQRVIYTLSETDAIQINRRRVDAEVDGPPGRRQAHVRNYDDDGAVYLVDGAITHIGNVTHAGDKCAAVVVRVWNQTSTFAIVNLQVFLDGNDAYWATSRNEQLSGQEPEGRWVRLS